MVGAAALVILFAGGVLFLLYGAGPTTEVCSAVPLQYSDGGERRAGLGRPMALARHGGLLYVADAENGAVKVFRDDGSLAAVWHGFRRPVDVAVADNAVYVADFLADEVVKLDRGGTVIRRWGETRTGPGEFDGPSGIAVGPHGHVYVADFYNHRVQKFTGDYLRKWGGSGYGLPGGWPGWFAVAKEIALGPRGTVYVADSFNGRVQKFTAGGELLAVWNGPDEGGPPVRYPAGVAVGRDGDVYVSDFFTNRIWTLECR